MTRCIDFDSFIPLYQQLKEIIEENIKSGNFVSGDRVPSENELINRFDVSRNTAKKALDELVQDGKLERVQGKGTFIARPKFEQPLTGFYSFSKVMKSKAMNPKDLIISVKYKAALPSIAKDLIIKENDQIIELKRVRYANEEPIIIETSYIPRKIVPVLTKEKIETTSLYDYLKKEYGIIVRSAKEIFEPVLIRDNESYYLGVDKGNPALLLDRITYGSKNIPVELCRSIIRGDRCRFYTELF